MASLIRITIFLGLCFGLYYFWPAYSPLLKALANQPLALISPLANSASPIIVKINSFLPDKLQLPAAKEFLQTKYETTPELQQLKEEIQSKATQAAQIQLEQLKKSATNQFCQVLIDKLQSECGQ